MKQTKEGAGEGLDRFRGSIVVGVGRRPLDQHVVRMAEDLGGRLRVQVHPVHAAPKVPDVWPGLDPARSDALTVELLDRARTDVEARIRPIVAASRKVVAGSQSFVADSGSFVADSGSVVADSRPKASDGAVDAKGRRGGAAVAEAALVDVVPGHPVEVLLDAARRHRASLFVLGAHEKRHLVDFGNTLRALYAKSRIPIWVQPGPVAPIRTILAAVDLSEDSLQALGAACDLARAFDAQVRAVECFHVSSVAVAGQIDSSWGMIDFPYTEVMRAERERFAKEMEAFDWKGVRHTTEFVEAPPVEGLLEEIGDADLVVLGTHGRTGLASVVLGGVAYSILKRSTKPTLAVPRAEGKFRIDGA
jgi:nucleotide-binding universal stress UspA family protein